MMNEECVTILRTQDFLCIQVLSCFYYISLSYVVTVLYFNPSYLYMLTSQVNI